MNDMTATWTVLARSDADPFGRPLVTPIIDAHDYDHAEMLFEESSPGWTILGIYEGDLSHIDAVSRYNEENGHHV